MFKKVLAILLLTALALSALTACGSKDSGDPENDKVIQIGTQKMTYTDASGDVFTYDYLTSTTITITAFAGKYEPHNVVIPTEIDGRAVVAIGEAAFRANSGISSITTEAKIQEIGDYAFASCELLTSFQFPAGLETIGKGAFYGCSKLASIPLPEGLKSIDTAAFWNCVSIENITFPASLETIGAGAFYGCEKLSALVIPEGTKTIGEQAFYACSGIQSITLPASVVEMGRNVFSIELIKALEGHENTIIAPENSYAKEYVDAIH